MASELSSWATLLWLGLLRNLQKSWPEGDELEDEYKEECIFCEEEVDSHEVECPHCGMKPFPGMYLDPKTYENADQMEKDGDLEGAWDLLHEEYRQHTDIEYFDEETAGILHDYLKGLFARHSEKLVAQRIDLLLDELSIGAYWGHYDDSLVEQAVQLAQDAERPDLELKVLEQHRSNLQTQSKGYGFDSESLDQRIAELTEQLLQSGE